MHKPIKIIDLFAGPGGLGEGFSSFNLENKHPFKIAISIEKETSAHKTLTLRSFFRQFENGQAPEEYYAFMRGELGASPEDELYKIATLKDAVESAKIEAQQLVLGETPDEQVYSKIRSSIDNEDCVLIGGPPCQAYSLVGRARNYGAKDKSYSAQDDHRNFLYQEYLDIIAKFQPLVFVMENVKGMLSAKVGGEAIFPKIMSDLKDPCKATGTHPDKKRSKHQYKIYSFVPKTGAMDLFDPQDPSNRDKLAPKDYIIHSENYGIPQTRHRVILLGIREDLAGHLNEANKLKESINQVAVQDVISDLPAVRSKLSKSSDNCENWRKAIQSFPASKINSLRKDSKIGHRVIDQFIENLRGASKSPESTGAEKGLVRGELSNCIPRQLRDWYQDEKLGSFITNHETRGHIATDLHRYMFYATHAGMLNECPNSHTLPEVLWPNHKNFGSGKFADRFKVQMKHRPGSTVTSHISKDGHAFIHYDPTQCRSLTVREAARIQTFPDNYHFVGNRTNQYVQVGNAVPPYLAKKLAEIVYKILT